MKTKKKKPQKAMAKKSTSSVEPAAKPVVDSAIKKEQKPESLRNKHIAEARRIQLSQKIRGAKMVKGMLREQKAIVKNGIKNA